MDVKIAKHEINFRSFEKINEQHERGGIGEGREKQNGVKILRKKKKVFDMTRRNGIAKI